VLIRLDPASGVSLSDQLAGSIRASIMAARVRSGERLPPARDLAGSLDINVHTVLRAYQALRDEGLIELRRGRGALVAADVRDFSALTAAVDAVVAQARAHDVPPAALAALIREAYS
jgi:GntR family transcriptional regulator